MVKIEIMVIKGIGYKTKTRLTLSKASLGGIKMKKLSVWLFDSFQIRKIISHYKLMSNFFNNFFNNFFTVRQAVLLQ